MRHKTVKGKNMNRDVFVPSGLAAPTILVALLLTGWLAAGCDGGGRTSEAPSGEAQSGETQDGEAPAEKETLRRGRAAYDRICATCHGRDANGIQMLGKGLRDNDFSQALSDEELVEFLREGRPATHSLNTTGIDMPPRGGDPTLSDEDLANIVAYLRTL